jgi:hypothetical protein
MSKISRRALSLGLAATPLLGVPNSFAQTADETRVAIIDSPDDVRPFISKLKGENVRVVIRYLARGWQDDLPHKRIAANGPVDACKDGHYYPATGGSETHQLLENGFGILLVYQYFNSDPRKFLFGLDPTGRANGGDPSTNHIGKARGEADADARATVEQLKAIGQPHAPIYFGLDFDLRNGTDVAKDENGTDINYSDGTPVSNDMVVTASEAYFVRLKQIFGSNRLGIYGNGFANEHLLGKNLVRYSWISASVSYNETARFLRTGRWHLFQQADRYWFMGPNCPSGLDVDSNIQNPSVSDIGAWNASGHFTIDARRTRVIFNKRVVATRNVPVYSQKDQGSPLIQKVQCLDTSWTPESQIRRNMTARVISDDGTWLEVDLDDDGTADGYAQKAGNFVSSIKQMPDY